MVKDVFSRQLLVTLIPAAFVLVALLAVSMVSDISVRLMTQDVNAIVNLHPFTGALSNLGVLLWCASAVVCAFSSVLIQRKYKSFSRFLLYSALLSAYLLFDDLFLLHEELAEMYLGLDEKFVYAAFGAAFGAYLIGFYKVILGTRFSLLLLALGFLAASVLLDMILAPWLSAGSRWEYLLEDGAKWLGIACWTSYYLRTSYQLVQEPASVSVPTAQRPMGARANQSVLQRGASPGP